MTAWYEDWVWFGTSLMWALFIGVAPMMMGFLWWRAGRSKALCFLLILSGILALLLQAGWLEIHFEDEYGRDEGPKRRRLEFVEIFSTVALATGLLGMAASLLRPARSEKEKLK